MPKVVQEMFSKFFKKKEKKRNVIVYRGAGGAIFSDNPGIKSKEEADHVIRTLLGETVDDKNNE